MADRKMTHRDLPCLCYLLLSPTWGMHQYTADLGNRMAESGQAVHLVTTRHAPRDRYAPAIQIHTPVSTQDRGFSPDALRPGDLARLLRTLRRLRPDLVHLTGPHLWNPLVLGSLRRAGVPVLHTLHDLHPHHGSAYGRLLYAWNRWVCREADHILVHGQRYRQELLAAGLAPDRVTNTPITHLFLSHESERALTAVPPDVIYEPWALFLGRLLPYKGLHVLVEAARLLAAEGIRVCIAGPGNPGLPGDSLPPGVELRPRLIEDGEALDLLRRCGLLILPYVEASQSALIAAAYFFQKPVIVTRAGALPEYVVEGETGWIVLPGDASALAEALQAALADPDRLARMGTAGRAWYDAQRRAEMETIRHLYRTLARSPHTPLACDVGGAETPSE